MGCLTHSEASGCRPPKRTAAGPAPRGQLRSQNGGGSIPSARR